MTTIYGFFEVYFPLPYVRALKKIGPKLQGLRVPGAQGLQLLIKKNKFKGLTYLILIR